MSRHIIGTGIISRFTFPLLRIFPDIMRALSRISRLFERKLISHVTLTGGVISCRVMCRLRGALAYVQSLD